MKFINIHEPFLIDGITLAFTLFEIYLKNQVLIKTTISIILFVLVNIMKAQ